MYLKSKYNHKGFHKSKILLTTNSLDTIDANNDIYILWQFKCSSVT